MTRIGYSQISPLPHWRLWPPLARPTRARTVAAMDPAQACTREGQRDLKVPVFALIASALLVACSNAPGGPAASGTGGSLATGGTSSFGGKGTGSNPETGGVTATGGHSATGGGMVTGGASSADSGSLTGGASGMGGSTASGGRSGPNGVGGTTGTGGATGAGDSIGKGPTTTSDGGAEAAGAGAVLYAAPSGSGTSCTLASPCTIDQAVTTVRGMTASMASDIVVYLRGGTYARSSTLTLGPGDSGTGTRLPTRHTQERFLLSVGLSP